jgi:hypothetical protein
VKEMKLLTLAICVSIIAALIIGTCGCTSSSNTASKATATPTATPKLAADNLADAINARYKELNYTVNTPFTMTKKEDYTVTRGDGTVFTIKGGLITYHGLVSSNSSRMNVTIMLAPNPISALTKQLSAENMSTINGTTVLYVNTCGELKDRTKPVFETAGIRGGRESSAYCEGSEKKASLYSVDSIAATYDKLWLARTGVGKFEYVYNAEVGNYLEILAVEYLDAQ